ncbi:hypothetical protein BP6252_11118 [Coleophoma cylindrospora]|uniref:Heterokaryon incompatibility domain-containing protein n=1 Tax=Coleophoma cylindrospora TaxID=1849047 RepID=A0A3D8QP23_9HELO|nr:hypothetical protein BP6252_11118 [Coleophoma cylindrospora]
MPRLYETGSTDGRWVALSYCWGSDASFMLTAASYQSLKQGIQLDAFPPTLRDALLVTRALGIPYIWIDALCIFQDSAEDWQKEAPQMKAVYSNADLVLAATSSDDVNAGIFTTRPLDFVRLPWITRDADGVPIPNEKGQQIGVRLKQNTNRFDEDQLFRASRWMSRGWTMQEDFLARRLLLFTKHTMTWECLEHAERENGEHITERGGPNRKSTRDFTSRYWKRSVAALGANSGSDQEASLRQDISDWAETTPYEMWHKTVQEYSKRRLTKHGDRLPALSGLAELVQEITGDSYCAGLWKNDLIRGLLWHYGAHRPYARERIYKYTPPLQPGIVLVETDVELTNNGPSWSWVSMEGDRFELFLPSDLPRPGQNGPEARIVDVHVDLARENDPFGSVLGGELTIEAGSSEWGGDFTEEPQSSLQKLVLELLEQPQRQRGFCAEYRLRHKQYPGQITAVLVLGFTSQEASAILIETVQQQAVSGISNIRPVYQRVGRFGIRTPDKFYTTLQLTDYRYQSLLEIESYEQCLQGLAKKTYTIV